MLVEASPDAHSRDVRRPPRAVRLPRPGLAAPGGTRIRPGRGPYRVGVALAQHRAPARWAPRAHFTVTSSIAATFNYQVSAGVAGIYNNTPAPMGNLTRRLPESAGRSSVEGCPRPCHVERGRHSITQDLVTQCLLRRSMAGAHRSTCPPSYTERHQIGARDGPQPVFAASEVASGEIVPSREGSPPRSQLVRRACESRRARRRCATGARATRRALRFRHASLARRAR
jgi:hypothetical protein